MHRAVPLLLLLLLTACAGRDDRSAGDTGVARPGGATAAGLPGDSVRGAATASATLRDTAGRELGTVTLADGDGGIVVEGTLQGLAPGERAIHVHAVGRCEPPFESAGPHWNPAARRHGSANPEGPHGGDLPNLVIRSEGAAAVRGVTPTGTLHGEGGLLDADGASVVVHAGADDHRTDPSGDSGNRVACGVVTAR